MANTTRAGALSIHGTNPQYLVPTVIRQRVYDTLYWSPSPLLPSSPRSRSSSHSYVRPQRSTALR